MRKTGKANWSSSAAVLVVMAVLGGLLIGGGVGAGSSAAGATPSPEGELIRNGGFDPDIHVPWWWWSGTAFTTEFVA